MFRLQADYERVLRPKIGKELEPLPFVVCIILAENDDFFFIQIGANDGKRDDHLRPLILKYHLRGLLVEPLPDVFVELKNNYTSEKQLKFVNAAIAKKDGESTL